MKHVAKPKQKRNVGVVDYASTKTPADYKCDKCGATGVKLWREYMVFLDGVTLRCAKCAGKHSKTDVSMMDENGTVPSQFIQGERTCEIGGGQIAAIPVEGEDTFWGLTSVPGAGVKWWRSLPNA